MGMTIQEILAEVEEQCHEARRVRGDLGSRKAAGYQKTAVPALERTRKKTQPNGLPSTRQPCQPCLGAVDAL